MRLTDSQLRSVMAQQDAGISPEALKVPPVVKRKRDNREHRIQAALIKWWANTHKEFQLPEEVLHSVPNGGFRSPITGAIMKLEGQRRGVFDLKLNVARAGYHGLWMEVKTPEGILSKEQKAFQQAVNLQGYCTLVCRSFEEGKSMITDYLNG